MANVKFLKGELAKINNWTGNSVAGAFYLAEDACRLYYGTGTGAPVPLNEQITVISSVAQLPNPARAESILYYAKTENILCISSGDAEKGWIQINPDTDTAINALTISTPTKDETSGSWTYDVTITEKNTKGDVIKTHTQTLTLTKDMIGDLAGVSIGIKSAAVASNATSISLEGTGAKGSVAISGGNNVTLSGAANNITIAAKDTTYDFSVVDGEDQASVVLKDTLTNDEQEAVFKAGAKINVDVTDNEITFAHETSGVTKGDIAASINNTNVNTPVISIPTITVDEYGHVTGKKDNTVSFTNSTYEAESITADGAKLKFSIKDQKGDSTDAESGDVLYYTITVDGKSKTVNNQGDFGSFYSAGEIDKMMKGIDAFTYKGVVAKPEDLPTTASLGDTYKIQPADGEVFVLNGEVGHVGDVVIAFGPEGTDGVITDLEWDILHTENNTDTTYTFGASGNQLILDPSNGDAMPVAVSGDAAVSLTAENDALKAAHVKHASAAGTFGGTTAPVGYEGQIVVPNITVDEFGHVSAASNATYTLPKEQAYDFAVGTNSVSIKNTTTDDSKGAITFTDDDKYIDVTVTGNGTADATVKVAHKTVTKKNTTTGGGNVGYAGSIAAITGITFDDAGHVSGYNTATYNLPAEVTYALSGATVSAVDGGVKVVDTLTNSKNDPSTSEFTLVSDTLAISATGTQITADLVWGEF